MRATAPNSPKTPLQRNLLHAIAAKGMSQRALAKASGINHAQISRLLSGTATAMTPASLGRVAAALDLSVEQLCGAAPPGDQAAAPPPPAPLQVGSEDAAAIADPAAFLLRLDELAANPLNPRQTSDPVADAELEASIAAVGLLTPLKVVAEPDPGDGRPLYRVWDGGRRLAALRNLAAAGRFAADQTLWPARLTPAAADDETEVRVLMLVANIQRLDLAPLDQAHAFAELRKLGLSTLEIAERVGRTQRHVQVRLAFVERLAPELQQRLADGAISVEQARALAGAPAHLQAAIAKGFAAGRGVPAVAALERRIEAQTVPVARAAFRLDDYTAAGGIVVEDEATRERRCLDGKLFRRLQRRAAKALQQELILDNAAFVDLLEAPPADGAYVETHDPARAGAIVWLDPDLTLKHRRGVRRADPPAPASTTPQADAQAGEARAAVGAEIAHGLAAGRYKALALLLLEFLAPGEAPLDLARLEEAATTTRIAELRADLERRRAQAAPGADPRAIAWHFVRGLDLEALLDGLAGAAADAFVLGEDAVSRELAGAAIPPPAAAQAAGPDAPGAGAGALTDIPEFLRRQPTET